MKDEFYFNHFSGDRYHATKVGDKYRVEWNDGLDCVYYTCKDVEHYIQKKYWKVVE